MQSRKDFEINHLYGIKITSSLTSYSYFLKCSYFRKYNLFNKLNTYHKGKSLHTFYGFIYINYFSSSLKPRDRHYRVLILRSNRFLLFNFKRKRRDFISFSKIHGNKSLDDYMYQSPDFYGYCKFKGFYNVYDDELDALAYFNFSSQLGLWGITNTRVLFIDKLDFFFDFFDYKLFDYFFFMINLVI